MTTLGIFERRPAPDPSTIPPDAPGKWREAPFYQADLALRTAMDMAIALRHPLLLTGQPGCGKTSAAYWAGYRLGLSHNELFHVQVRSDATAAKLKYEVDSIEYFRESQIAAAWSSKNPDKPAAPPRRGQYLSEGPLWKAFVAAQTRDVVLLFDEIDKAPRDFPNDLLHELDQHEFPVPERPDPQGLPTVIHSRSARADPVFLTIITSNRERDLPAAFLRRCIHHEIRINYESPSVMSKILAARKDIRIGDGLRDLAVRRFVEILQTGGLRHKPSLSELLVWLRVLGMAEEAIGSEEARKLRAGIEKIEDLKSLPYLGALLKDPDDLALLGKAKKPASEPSP